MTKIDKIRNLDLGELRKIMENSKSLSDVFRALGCENYRNQIIIDLLREKIKSLNIEDSNEFFERKKFDIKKEELENAVKNSFTISETLKKLGLAKYNSGNYYRFKFWKNKYSLNTSHFKGQGWTGKRGQNKKWELKDMLIENSLYQSRTDIKKKILKEGLLENKCYECGITEWRGKRLINQLEHKNGISNDYRIENLTMLCPNCHSQTKTYAGRNVKVNKKEIKSCKCGKEINKNSVQCKVCLFRDMRNGIITKKRKIKNRPSIEQLLKEIEETSFVAVGKKYGVSDNAIRKWIGLK